MRSLPEVEPKYASLLFIIYLFFVEVGEEIPRMSFVLDLARIRETQKVVPILK